MSDSRREKQREYDRTHREQLKLARQRWLRINADKRRATKRRWYNKHRQEILAKLRLHRAKWRDDNREKVREYQRRNYQLNISRLRAKSATRRARRQSAAGSHTHAQWLARVNYHGWRCRWCDRVLTVKTLTKDHVIPISAGGPDWASNLVPACGSCNSGKRNKKHYVPPAP